jgi:hypothetical protein
LEETERGEASEIQLESHTGFSVLARRGDRVKENLSGSGGESERGRKRVTEGLVIRAESERSGECEREKEGR